MEDCVAATVEAARDAGVARAVEDQVAIQHAVGHDAVGHEVGEEPVVRPQRLQRRRCGQELDVGRGRQRRVGIDGVQRVATVQRNHQDTPLRVLPGRAQEEAVE